MLVLGQAVRNLVVVAFVCHMDVNPQLGIRGQVECAHGNPNPVFLDRVPEQGRAARRTEPSPHLLGGAEPGDFIATVDRQSSAGDVGGCEEMARVLAALRAMAGIGQGQIAGDLEPHSPAKTRSLVHAALPLIVCARRHPSF